LLFICVEHLAHILFLSKDPEHTAVHLFLLLDWNLISRAEQVAKTYLNLGGVSNDALKLFIVKSKGDQEDTKHIDHPWHVYSMPKNPLFAKCWHWLDT
jgi:hypothetical protein